MRIVLTLSLVWISTIALSQIGAKTKQSSQLAGLWQNNQFGYQMTLMLNADGTGEFDGDQIKYVTKPGVLAITSQQTTTDYKYTLNGNSLTVSGGDLDQAVTFTRAGTNALQETVTTSPPTDTPSATGDKALIGTWSGNGETIEFKPNGQCIYLGNTFPYQVSQGHITLSSQQGSAMFAYTVSGSQLTMTANGNQVVYTRGAANSNTQSAPTGSKGVPQELVGKWCWINVTNTNSGAVSSDRCITLNGDGTYVYYAERSTSVNDPSFVGGTNSQSGDQGTWWVQGDRIFYNSQTRGQGSYRLEKRNHPKNVNDPMIVLDGEAYVTQYQKAPWR